MPDETTVTALAEALHEAECTAYRHEGRNARCEREARAILASPALADLLRAERVRALREAADTDEPGFYIEVVLGGGEYVRAWLRDRADREAER